MWVCRQHGKNCRSYVAAIVNRWNRAGYTPDTLPDSEKHWLCLVMWQEDDSDG